MLTSNSWLTIITKNKNIFHIQEFLKTHRRDNLRIESQQREELDRQICPTAMHPRMNKFIQQKHIFTWTNLSNGNASSCEQIIQKKHIFTWTNLSNSNASSCEQIYPTETHLDMNQFIQQQFILVWTNLSNRNTSSHEHRIVNDSNNFVRNKHQLCSEEDPTLPWKYVFHSSVFTKSM